MTRVLLGVRGMNTQETSDKVREVLMGLEGVEKVEAGVDGQAAVTYDDSSATVMDFIRALRRVGFLAGME